MAYDFPDIDCKRKGQFYDYTRKKSSWGPNIWQKYTLDVYKRQGVGTVTESDVMLAGTTGSVIIGFNVRPSTAVQTFADRENIQIRLYKMCIRDSLESGQNPLFQFYCE